MIRQRFSWRCNFAQDQIHKARMTPVTRYIFFMSLAVLKGSSLASMAPNDITLKGRHGIALHGYSFKNRTNTTVSGCLKHCLKDCRCSSFQICHNSEYQLCSSTIQMKIKSTKPTENCTHFVIEANQNENDNQFCGSSCLAFPNCCLTSKPCENGGTCIPSFSTSSTSRFACTCQEGYTGTRCQVKILSCRGYSKGKRLAGMYKISDDMSNVFKVFCDFDKTSTMTWTLIQSYERKSVSKFRKSFYSDSPVKEDKFSWSGYRLSKSRMASIQRDSKKWRQTCNYDEKHPQPYHSDHVISSNEIDILNYNLESCRLVEYIQVKGLNCSNCTAFIAQKHDGDSSPPRALHFKPVHSTKECDFKPNGITCSKKKIKQKESNFGHYACFDTLHNCSASPSSTTQTWFGG